MRIREDKIVSGLEEMRAKLDALKEAARKAEANKPDFAQMQARITNVSASATSQDKAVTVTAGPGGSITGIEFKQDAMKLSPLQLSSTVMSTLREAVAAAARQQAEVVQEFAPDSDVMERVLATQEQIFGATAERQDPATSSSDDDPDDYDEDSSLLDDRRF